MTKVFNAQEQCVQYIDEGEGRALWREGQYVFKRDPVRLNNEWKSQMKAICKVWRPPGFLGFIENGYMTHYMNGTDLQGNKAFTMDGSLHKCVLPPDEYHQVRHIFKQVEILGEKLGFTFGDMTCGNLFLSDGIVNMIDYDVIVEYPLPTSYRDIWNNTLRIIFGD